jgi:hypothetical protein
VSQADGEVAADQPSETRARLGSSRQVRRVLRLNKSVIYNERGKPYVEEGDARARGKRGAAAIQVSSGDGQKPQTGQAPWGSGPRSRHPSFFGR